MRRYLKLPGWQSVSLQFLLFAIWLPDQPEPDQTNQTKPNETRPDDQTKPDKTEADLEPDLMRHDEAEPNGNRTISAQAKHDKARPDIIRSQTRLQRSRPAGVSSNLFSGVPACFLGSLSVFARVPACFCWGPCLLLLGVLPVFAEVPACFCWGPCLLLHGSLSVFVEVPAWFC